MSSSALNSHADLFEVNVSLGAQPDSGFLLDFSSILVVENVADSNLAGRSGVTALGSANTSKYTVISEGETLDGGFSTTAKRVINSIFSAKQHPKTVKFLAIDFANDDVADMPAELQALDVEYYWVVPTTTIDDDAADNFDIPIVVEGFNTGTFSAIIMAGISTEPTQASDITRLSAMSAGNKERLYLTYNSNIAGGTPTADDGLDYAEICAVYASVDYDNNSPGGNLALTHSNATTLTSATAKTFIRDNNINFAGPISGASAYVDAGVMFNARPVYQVVFGDVIENRIQVDIMRVKADLASRTTPEKLPMTRTGQALVSAKLDARIQGFQRAGHILTAEEADDRDLAAPYVKAETITSDDITNRRLRFGILQYHLDDARKIRVDINLV